MLSERNRIWKTRFLKTIERKMKNELLRKKDTNLKYTRDAVITYNASYSIRRVINVLLTTMIAGPNHVASIWHIGWTIARTAFEHHRLAQYFCRFYQLIFSGWVHMMWKCKLSIQKFEMKWKNGFVKNAANSFCSEKIVQRKQIDWNRLILIYK